MPLILRQNKDVPLTHSELDGNLGYLESRINDLVSENANFTLSWTELTSKPVLFSGDYNDLNNLPTLFDGDYNSLTNLPGVFDGDYDNLTNKPFLPSNLSDLSDTNITSPSVGHALLWNGAQWWPQSVFDGDYTNLTNTPLIPSNVEDLANIAPTVPTSGQVLKWDGSQWAPANDAISSASLDADLLNGQAGSYYLDWTNITNPPALFDGEWNSLIGKPIIPEVLTQLSISDGSPNQVLSTDGSGNFSFVDQLDTGIAYTDLSVGADDLANGQGGIDYDSSTGTFTYTPPDLTIYSQFNGDYNSLANRPAIPTNIGDLSDVDNAIPVVGYVLKWSGTSWSPAADAGGSGGAAGALSIAGNIGIGTVDIDTQTFTVTGTANQINTLVSGQEVTLSLSDSLVLEGSITSDFIGSVFADDSTLLVDGVNGAIPWSVLDGTPTTLAGYGITDAPVVTGHSNLIAWDLSDAANSKVLDAGTSIDTAWYYGDVVSDPANPNTSVVLDISQATFAGNVMGEVHGDVKQADGLTLILDVDAGVGTAMYYGDVTGNVTGDVTGFVENEFDLTGSASPNYVFNADSKYFLSNTNNPTLYLKRGERYKFENISGSHPFRIQSVNSAAGTLYNDGVTNNGGTGTVTFIPPMDAPDELYYYCTNHSSMNGVIKIVGEGSTASARTTGAATATALGDESAADITIPCAKTFTLLKIQTSHAAWVTLYIDTASRTNDAGRDINTDPEAGSGVLAEVITSDGSTINITPGTIGWNNDGTPAAQVYAKVVNKSGSQQDLTVTLHYVALEV